MTNIPSNLHLHKVQAHIEAMSGPAAFVFAAACTERQLPVYEKAAEGKPWNKTELLRECLDTVWHCLAKGNVTPLLSQRCEQAAFDDIESDADALAQQVVENLCGLTSIIESNEPHHAFQAAQSNIELIVAFLYESLSLEVCDESDVIIDNHILMRTEIARQDKDLAELRDPLSLPHVAAFAQSYKGQSLLGKEWVS